MIIDFHTHIFPDKIASSAIDILSKKSGLVPQTNGTALDLQNKTKDAKIDYSLILPVVTSPKQTKSINDFAALINNDNINYPNLLSFGGMHPDYELYEEELLRIKSLGLKGIKLHPQYQNTFIDDIRYQKIIGKAFELGLIVIIHAGIDIGIPGDVCATPQRILNLYNNLNHKGIFVLAHMGSWLMWDEVYEKILGKDFYIDTAFSLNEAKQNNEIINLLKEENIKKFISKHGSNKILFGTDSPWANQKEYLDYMNNLNIDKNDLNNILGLNAKRILNM